MQSCLQVMVPNNFQEFINDLKSLVTSNVIPLTRIDDAVRRILRVKFIMGLFENPMADLSLVNQIGSQVRIDHLFEQFYASQLKSCSYEIMWLE